MGYHSTKFFVSFSEVPVKLRLIFNRIMLSTFHWSIYGIIIEERLSVFLGFRVFCVSFAYLCLASVWE